MSVEYLEIDPGELWPNPWNSNVVSPENERKIEEGIKRHGMFKPTIVRTLLDGRLQIIGGQHRAMIAKRLGLLTVPVMNLGRIDEARAKEIGLIDNGRYGEDDIVKLNEILHDLGGIDELIDVMPWSSEEIDIFSSTNIALDALSDLDSPSEEVELPKTTKVQTHQIMRFKVPIEDVDAITKLIEKTIKAQGFTESDSLTNAGDALVYLLGSK